MSPAVEELIRWLEDRIYLAEGMLEWEEKRAYQLCLRKVKSEFGVEDDAATD